MKTPNLDPVVIALPPPAAPSHGASDGPNASPTESFGQVMARVGGESRPKSESTHARHDGTPKPPAAGAGAAAEARKAGQEHEAQVGADDAASSEVDDGNPSGGPAGEDQSPSQAAPSIDALLVPGGEVSKPVPLADDDGNARPTSAPIAASLPAAARASTPGATSGSEPGSKRATEPTTTADSAKAAGPVAPTPIDSAEQPVRQDAKFASAVQSAMLTSRPQSAPGVDRGQPADNGAAGAMRALLLNAASANDQTKAVRPDQREVTTQVLSALPPQRAPIAEALATLAAQSGRGEAVGPAAHEQSFERLLGSRTLGAARTEAAPYALPFANVPATTTVAAPETVATPVGQPGFAQDLSHRVMLLVNGQVKSAELALTPAELGPVRVSIELRGQDASISFVAAAPATRAALEEALPRLREMFTQQGLNLLDANVGAHVGQQGQRTFGRPQAAAASSRDDNPAMPALSAVNELTAGSGRPARLIDVIA